MKQLIPFIRKEFLHVLRDRRVLLILFGLPIVQVLLFGFALSNEIKNTKVAVFDQDQSAQSLQLSEKINQNAYFDIIKNLKSQNEFEGAFKNGQIKVIINIPQGFGSSLNKQQKSEVQLITDGIDLNIANQLSGFLRNILNDFYRQNLIGQTQPYSVVPEIRMLYNPQLKGAPNFVPGVMAMILLIVCVMMTAIAIVKEKESGTMEVLLVSPMRPSYIIISKAVPYFVLSVLVLSAILVLSVTLLDLPILGSLFLLLFVSIIYILTSLFLGILISIISKTQQQAMILSLIGMFLPTLLLSGFMFPIENMPIALQVISNIVPAKWYYLMIKNIMIKGTGLEIIWHQLLILSAMMVFLFVVSMKKFKIRLE
ncbi:ABC transporter permease [Chryseobacterium koreense]|uniref:ABC transporter permease n=1 Tax=Chryseobacterium koreense TaxID=232216 RepID=UPI0026EAB6A1|nr:ABC transporter permease [Chryseobacterium koreense]